MIDPKLIEALAILITAVAIVGIAVVGYAFIRDWKDQETRGDD